MASLRRSASRRATSCLCAVLVLLALAVPRAASGAGYRVFALLPGNVLIRFESDAPGVVTTLGPVTGIGPNETICGIDFRPRTGQLLAATVTTGSSANSVLRTYVVDPGTAAATLIGATAAALAGAGDVATGFDFNPTVDRLRYVNTNDENARLNPGNGALSGNDTDLNPAATSDLIAVAYDRSFDRQTVAAPANDAIPTTLYVIDRNTGTLAILGGTDGSPTPNGGTVTDVASLGVGLSQTNDGGFDIVPGVPEAAAFAALTAVDDGLTRLYAIDLDGTSNVATPIGLVGTGTTQVRGLAIVPDRIEVVGADGRSTPQVRVFAAGAPAFDLDPYPTRFKGGIRVAAGDVNGDGVYDVVTGSGRKQFPHVRVFDGATRAASTSVLGSFLAFDAAFTGGVFVAAGDVNGDGFDDVVVAPDAGAAPQVRVFSGRNGDELRSFLAYPVAFRGGVRVASGDVNGDGLADIVTGTGPGTPAQVKVFSGVDASELSSFLAFDPGFVGGVFVASGDVNGDGVAEIVTGAGAGGGPHVKVFSGANGSVVHDFQAFAERAKGGVRVACTDVNRDGRPDIVVGLAPRVSAEVRAFDGRTLTQLQSVLVFERGPRGVFVGG